MPKTNVINIRGKHKKNNNEISVFLGLLPSCRSYRAGKSPFFCPRMCFLPMRADFRRISCPREGGGALDGPHRNFVAALRHLCRLRRACKRREPAFK